MNQIVIMKTRIYNLLGNKYLPQGIVLIVDLSIVLFSFITTYVLRFSLSWSVINPEMMMNQLLLVFPFYLMGFLLFKPYVGIIRHTTTMDTIQVIKSTLLGSLLLGCSTLFLRYVGGFSDVTTPISVVFVHLLYCSALLIMMRLGIKWIYHQLIEETESIKVAVYGAGSLGQKTVQVLRTTNQPTYNPVAFVDDNRWLRNKKLKNIPVIGNQSQLSILKEMGVKQLILAIHPRNFNDSKRRSVVNEALMHGIVVKEAPNVEDWFEGDFSASQIRTVNVEDLLERDPIQVDTKMIQSDLLNKVVLITGAAGSIGSEIVRQLSYFNTKELILVDQAESGLYDLQNEIRELNPLTRIRCIVTDASNRYRMEKVFKATTPSVIYHAAAYKHVPLMEDQPYDALRVNVGSVKTMSDLAVLYHVDKFVLVSTDKAVNPTNVMGASKRICELYVQSLAQQADVKTEFITTRFGNVLGSNGSVVPLFKKQIEKGGPLTVTHKEITRYFMTIPEACQLVLQAGSMGNGGEIYIFDMGKPVRIYDLAHKMIVLSGLTPDRDIEIQVTGLRPGEKLYEELLASKENTLPTHHHKILIGKVRAIDIDNINHEISELLNSLEKVEDFVLVKRMKQLVPEFKSQNSKYSILDNQTFHTSRSHLKIKKVG